MKKDNSYKKFNSIGIKIIDYLNNINPSGMNLFDDHNEILISKILDSMEMINLLVFLEKTFDINIDADNVLLENFENVRSIVEFVKKLRNEKNNRHSLIHNFADSVFPGLFVYSCFYQI